MHQSRTSSRQGVALVLVLAFLALISVFIVGFFSSATGELSASSSYAASVNTRQLADTAVSLVEGNIRAATTRPAQVVNDPKKDFDSWASQPGAIRTFAGGQTANANGPTALYKLYSAKEMIVDGPEASGYDWSLDIPNGVGTGWQSQPALYTDINEPVLVKDPVGAAGSLLPRYPVFDPSVFIQLAAGQKTAPLATALPPGKIEGATLSPDLSLPADQQYSRMPVRWLYILKDGTVSSPGGSKNAGRIATFDTTPVNQPTVENPIVGRIAYWTDDDTCRVNINTAGGFLPASGGTVGGNASIPSTSTSSPRSQLMYAGSYWDTPRINTKFDRGDLSTTAGTFTIGGLGGSQPSANEYQRFPGHPATTSLGLMLQNVLSPAAIANLAPPAGGTHVNDSYLYNLTPRLVTGGSKGGTALAKPDVNKALVPKVDRLYGSVDELLYSTSTDPLIASQASQRLRDPSTSAAPAGSLITATNVEQLRFFLTAHSRAPELNLFGRPRITLWPVYPIFASSVSEPHTVWTDIPSQNSNINDTIPSNGSLSTQSYDKSKFRTLSTTEDKLIAFCSTIGLGIDDAKAKPYIFQRYDPYSQTNDQNISRNQDLLKILRDETATPVPGFGGSFLSKWGATDRDQVLTEMFDYIRCVNLRDTNHDDPPKYNIASETAPTYATLRNTFKYAPHAVVVPSVIDKSQKLPDFNRAPGFGRFPLISEVGIDFYHAGYLAVTLMPGAQGKPPTPKFSYIFDRNLAHKAPGLEPVTPGAPRDPLNFWGYYKPIDPNSKAETDPFTKQLIPSAILGRMIGAFLVIETFNPMQGYALMDAFDPNWEAGAKGGGRSQYIVHEISGLDNFKIKTLSMSNYQSLQMPAHAQNAYFTSSVNAWAGRGTGGAEGFVHPFLYGCADTFAANAYPVPMIKAITAFNGNTWKNWYPFQSTPGLGGVKGFPADANVIAGNPAAGIPPITLPSGGINPLPPHNPLPGSPPNGILVRNYRKPVAGHPYPETDTGDSTFDFTGGKLSISVEWGPMATTSQAINTYTMTFPAGTGWPIPTDNIWYGSANKTEAASSIGDAGGFMQPAQKMPATLGPDDMGWQKAWENDANNVPQADLQFYFRKRVLWCRQRADNPWKLGAARDYFANTFGDGLYYGRRWRQMLQPGDTIRSMVPQNPKTGSQDGDPRVMALLGPGNPPDPLLDKYFGPHPYYNGPAAGATYNAGKVQRHACGFRAGDGTFYIFNRSNPTGNGSIDSRALEDDSEGNPQGNGNLFTTDFGSMVNGAIYNLLTAAGLPPSVKQVSRYDGPAGDFDTGVGAFPDGGYANKPDEGTFPWVYWDTNQLKYFYATPYFLTSQYEESAGSYFSPNRQVQSAVMFGSLLAGRKLHWTTLAFSPNTAGANHPGLLKSPKDHLLLDLFTMPVVEPYPISEPFSTAGKVNLNYVIEPFNHITRSSALRAALHPLRVTAMEPTLSNVYKIASNTGILPSTENPRYPVDRDATIYMMDKFFFGTPGSRNTITQNTQDQIFRSASQICEEYLVPYQPVLPLPTNDPTKLTTASMSKWWQSMSLTGDNLREKPYADLYPRVTTKSNTYTVYMRVQVLRKRPVVATGKAATQAAQQWDEDKDQVLSEYRGSASIERYLDPADPLLIDRAANKVHQDVIDPDQYNIEPLYKFRVVESKRFQP